MRKLYDLHVHSNYSHDALQTQDNSINSLCKKAMESGLSGIAFSNHLDIDRYLKGLQPLNMDGIKSDCAQATADFPNFEVIHAVEIGQQMYYQGVCDEIIKKYNFDMVITSDHILYASEEYLLSHMDFSKLSVSEASKIYEIYLSELLYTAKYCNYDVLAHMTYPIRYLRKYNMEKAAEIKSANDIYDEILKTLVSRGKALEINTSGLRQGLGEALPNFNYIKRYTELGGELITVGSDSHYPRDIGANISETCNALSQMNVKYTCFYKNRKPVMVKL